jgi:predicted nucleotidyltransferase component of viral defense system
MATLDQVLDADAWRVCSLIGASNLGRSYYLAGGTALALQICHRKSYDLDYFQRGNEEKINFDQIYREITNYIPEKNIRVDLRKTDQATISANNTKITFLAYPYPLMESLVDGEKISRSRLKGIKLASPAEISLMKAYSIGRRTSYRDYVDLYELLHTGKVTLDFILKKAQQKYNTGGEILFSPKLFLQQLVYTEDVKDKDVALQSVLGSTVSSEAIDEFFGRIVSGELKSQTTIRRRETRP